MLLAIAVLGEIGHQLFRRWGEELAHHAFHLLFGVGAFVLFAIFVVIDMVKHGRPRFTWRLRP